MSAEAKREIELEIAYVLFVDIVGYSKLVTSEQRRLLELLNRIVRQSEHFQSAEAKHRLLTVPTGDGMALVFYNTPAAPVGCALEISRAASEHPELQLRMGIHSGPVSGVVDVSGRSNIAGAGINVAQRVMIVVMLVTSWCRNTWRKTWSSTASGSDICTISANAR